MTDVIQVDPGRVASAALQAFFSISSSWDLSVTEQRMLLGSPPDSIFQKWQANRSAQSLSRDTLDRISYLLGIYRDLNMLLPSKNAANEWIHKPNNAPLFNGQSALDRMMAGSIIDLADIRRYLSALRN